jgi:hypothetical protein
VQAFAFAPQHDARRAGEVSIRIILFRALVEPDEPVACFLELFHRAREIHHARDGQMRQRPGGGARHAFRKARGAALGKYQPIGTRGQRRAHNSAQVLRVFDAVEQHQQALLRVFGPRFAKEVFERQRELCAGQGDDALMLARAGQAVELRALLKPHRDAARAGQLHDFFDALAAQPAGDYDALDGCAGLERFVHGVNSSQPIHLLTAETQSSQRTSLA